MDAMMRKERIDRGLKVRTEGIYAISSLREILYLMGPRILLIAGLFALPFVFELAPYWKKVINIMCAYALLALAFDFLANYVGLVCLGGAFFTGVGGYFAAIFNTTLGMPIWLSMPLATIAGAGFCTLLPAAVPTASGCILRNCHPDVPAAFHPDHRGARHIGRDERHDGDRCVSQRIC